MLFSSCRRWSLAILAPGLVLSACGRFSESNVVGPSYLNKVIRPLARFGSSHDKSQEQVTNENLRLNTVYYFLLGQRLSALGRTDDSITALERVRSLDPDAAFVHQALAEEYLRKGSSREGVALLKKSIELDPKNRESKLLLANLQVTAKKFADAKEILEELAEQDPTDEEVILNLSLLELEERSFDSATRRLNKFLKVDPESALAYFYLGRIEQERGHKGEALKAYLKATELRSGFVQAGTYLGFLQEDMGDRKGALETFTWLAAQTDGARYHKKLGQLLLENNDYAKSLQAFLNYERLDPQDLNNKVKIGLLYVEAKQMDLAEKKFREVLTASPDSENVRFYLASVFEESKKYADALREYEKMPESSKLYLEALRRRAWVYQKMGKVDAGVALIEKALPTVAGDDARLEELTEMAVNYYAANKRESQAASLLDQALERAPDSERLLYSKGVLLEHQGRPEEAVQSMQQVLKHNPDHAAALNFIGFSWADRNTNLPQAEQLIRRALKLRPDDAFITDSLGWVLYRRGRYLEAMKYLQIAQPKAPQEAVIADHLGDVLVKLGRLAEAKAQYEKALALGPEKESDKKSIESKLEHLTADIQSRCRNGGMAASQHCSAAELREPRVPASAANQN
ncbi:MAG: tetratricopeptide repeat protein [Bdellovibrionales bacterium]|nr:tetratricopeptide repeat protein [Bdellovibrionales bacterium]